jgi:dipeptidyl aminopeptidase/acylaminoacyl peptidase
MPPRIAPYGSWESPITAERIAAQTVAFGGLALDGTDIYWSESRPTEGGRQTIMRLCDGALAELLPAPFNARTRAHEYGGGAFTVAEGVVYFSHYGDQRVYRLEPGAAPRPITSESPCRYADLLLDRRRARLIAVAEDHSSGTEPLNSLVAIDPVTGRTRTLAAGADFYSSPALHPHGHALAWLSWNHPNMPWDGTELWLAELDAGGAIRNARCIAGGASESVFQPQFAPDGTLYFVSDRNGWWNLHRLRDGRVKCVHERRAEFGLPQWVFGMSTYAFVADGRIACAFSEEGRWQLGLLDAARGTLAVVETPYSDLSLLRAAEGQAVFVGAAPREAPAIVRLDLSTRAIEVLRRSVEMSFDAGLFAHPQPIRYPTAAGETAHAFFYPPANADFSAPPGEKPPLLVLSHGGPTSSASGALNLKVQFWTSRGFAVLDVNYRGSTGYGRSYREKLNGQWGVADVEDCIAGARYLVAQGLVDGARLAIRGGSAGGYTTLCALAFHDLFHAGASYYGVSDLEALARDTHKFEKHYLDRLIGAYPAQRDLYLARSPIHHLERLSCPAIFFQGLDDKVVPPNQTEAMVAALRRKGIAVAYVPFEGEAHGFRKADNIRRALEAELYFYSRVFNFTPAGTIEPVSIENL